MKVLLLFPPITVNKESVKKCSLPIGLAYIASYLEKHNHEVICVDLSLEGYETEKEHDGKITFGLNDNEIKDRIREIKPDLIGISCSFSSQLHNAIHTSKLVKEVCNAPIVMAGVHPSFDAENILKKEKTADYVIIGEGEETMLELANEKPLKDIDGLAYRLSDKIIINKPRKLIENLDKLPFPARHLFNMEKYIKINKPFNHFPKKDRVLAVITSRGCYGRCTFCSSTKFWGNRLRVRSVDNIIEEMEMLIEKYNVQEIQLEDDNLTGIPGRAKKLFEKMIDLGIVWSAPNGVRIDTIDEEMLRLMKESGCYRLTYAIESGDKHILHNIIKKPYDLEKVKEIIDMTKKVGIGVHTYWIIGFPDETKEQMWKSFDMAKSLNTESSSFCLASPMIGTELLSMCKEQDLLDDDYDVIKAHYRKADIKNPNISKEELEKLCDYFNNKINSLLLWRNPILFFKKYHKAMLKNPKGIVNMFKKFS